MKYSGQDHVFPRYISCYIAESRLLLVQCEGSEKQKFIAVFLASFLLGRGGIHGPPAVLSSISVDIETRIGTIMFSRKLHYLDCGEKHNCGFSSHFCEKKKVARECFCSNYIYI